MICWTTLFPQHNNKGLHVESIVPLQKGNERAWRCFARNLGAFLKMLIAAWPFMTALLLQ